MAISGEYNASGLNEDGYVEGERSASGEVSPESTEPSKTSATKAVTTKLTMRPGMENIFANWQASFTRAVSAATGFVSLEIIPAFSGATDWQVIQRFHSPETLAEWMSGDVRAALLAELKVGDGRAQGSPADEAAPDYHSTTTVTEVITTIVKPGQDAAFRIWTERMQQVQSRFPGFMGTLVQAPLLPEVPYWTTLVRFETPGFLEAWLNSSERKAILAEQTDQVSTWQSHRMNNGFASWFADDKGQSPPPAWKQTCLVLLVLFPVVMLEIMFLSPMLRGLHVAISTFIGNAISVTLVSWPLMAVAILGMGWWLRPGAQHRWRTELFGALALAILYAAEILIFMRFM